mmetsp:Transcript_29916/g.64062  ORF Transcript_29916/g.64062 Transcript_29916/m.64062 type:complete len:303 (-) Transcript_29916:817-1725(-)|eukprot:CAMPEP_0201138416 /NCGR_PEP_ID=MMETSP0850-20130426/55918_1 /ASSEMBLY_ACC=CAM_ASM_000622 /TAXON_ID=183588 /ORGANISM="Pseudo-nitzschia fraudulenta, Strain WWA7" /LENGTH=302 /DNA_ID=CAMNT_0047409809 /DNA_START=236 /DNA_END=1144 /DNA_ORIENTATION=+
MATNSFLILVIASLLSSGNGLQTPRFVPRHLSSPVGAVQRANANIRLRASAETDSDETKPKKDNKAMAFLRKIGKVGGTKVDFTNAIGVDEGSGGAKISSNAGKCDHDIAVKKAKHAYRSCTDSGTIDDLSEAFPITCSGTQWAGVTDGSMGGSSSGTLVREEFRGRTSNVLTANVRLENDGGFVQMVTDLALDHSVSNTVDATNYDGVEFDVCYQGDADKENFNVHLKDSHCVRQFSSYRATFELTQGRWTTVRLPWDRFDGFGWGAVENLLDQSALRRIGLVAIGKEMDVTLALSSIRFF